MTQPTLIPDQRHLFDIPADVAYLNCAYMSPLAKAVVAAGEAGLRRKAQPWDVTPQDFSPTAKPCAACSHNWSMPQPAMSRWCPRPPTAWRWRPQPCRSVPAKAY